MECLICHLPRSQFICQLCNNREWQIKRNNILRIARERREVELPLEKALFRQAQWEQRLQIHRQRRERVAALQHYITEQRNIIHTAALQVRTRRLSLQKRYQQMKTIMKWTRTQKKQLSATGVAIQNIHMRNQYLLGITATLHQLQTYKIQTLLLLYPTKRVHAAACAVVSLEVLDDLEWVTASLTNQQQQQQHSNSDRHPTQADVLATALGYVLLLTTLFSNYLHIHLPYAQHFAGDRSYLIHQDQQYILHPIIQTSHQQQSRNNNTQSTDTADAFRKAATLLALNIQYLCRSVGLEEVRLWRLIPNLLDTYQAITLNLKQRNAEQQQTQTILEQQQKPLQPPQQHQQQMVLTHKLGNEPQESVLAVQNKEEDEGVVDFRQPSQVCILYEGDPIVAPQVRHDRHLDFTAPHSLSSSYTRISPSSSQTEEDIASDAQKHLTPIVVSNMNTGDTDWDLVEVERKDEWDEQEAAAAARM